MSKTIVKITNKHPEVKYTCPRCKATIEENFTDFVDEQEFPWDYFADWAYLDMFCPECSEKITNVEYDFE